LVLREIIIRSIAADSDCEQKLIKKCSDFAEAYLRMRTKKDSYLFNLISSSLKDIALGCVAELFEKKEGRLVLLETYFSGLMITKESEYHTHLRRLVFSKVNETLFEYYKSFDPSLGKIIRNIKRVLKEDDFQNLEYNPESKLITSTPLRPDNPLMPADLLEIKLSYRFKYAISTKDVLQQVSDIFDIHDEYNGRIKLSILAQIIRRLHQFYNEDAEHFNFSEHEELEEKELTSLIKSVVKKVRLDLYPGYVSRNKMSEEDFSKYFMVVEKVLIGDYTNCVENGKNYFEHFVDIVGEIDKEEYRNEHRKYVEYFVKQSREQLVLYLRKIKSRQE
jgi:hypothetical protein